MKYFALCLLSLWLIACGQTDDKNESTSLVIGMDLNFPPFEMRNQNNEPAGLSLDIAYALGDYLNKKVVIKNIAWSGLVPSLQTGQVDLIISSVAITPERLEVMDFSDPYAYSYLSALFHQDSGIKRHQDMDSSEHVIAVREGSQGHLYAGEHIKSARIKVFDQIDVAAMELISGQVDVLLYDLLTNFNYWKDYSDRLVFDYNMIESTEFDWGIALKKGNHALQNDINHFLRDFRAEGGFQKLAQIYFQEEIAFFEAHDIKLFFR